MGLSSQEKEAFNAACRINFQVYNQRISQIEADIKARQSPVKSVRAVQQVQKELKEMGPDNRPRILLFDFKDKPTRTGFFKRLNTAFQVANEENKSLIREQMQPISVLLAKGGFNRAQLLERLKAIEYSIRAIPKSDGDRKALETLLTGAFSRMNQALSGKQTCPEVDSAKKIIENKIRSVETAIKNMGQPTLTSKDYFPCIQEMKRCHTELKDIQQEIKKAQGLLKSAQMAGPAQSRYWNELRALWEKQSNFWNAPNLSHRQTFCEELPSNNFQYFGNKLEQIELEMETQSDRSHIQGLQKRIIGLEKELKEKEGNALKRPIKPEQWEEFFGRTWACKQQLQASWDGIGQKTNAEYDALVDRIKSLHQQMDKAQSKNALEQVKAACRELHAERKNKLGDNKLTPGQNHRLMKDMNFVYTQATELIEQLCPQDFSYEWLWDVYKRNAENGWVIFLKDVPAIQR